MGYKERREIESFLYLYPIAIEKCAEFFELLSYSKVKKERGNFLKSEYEFNQFLIHRVEGWLEYLYPDEKEIISYRYFKNYNKNYNYEQISKKLNYCNHSSVLKKTTRILIKLERRLSNE